MSFSKAFNNILSSRGNISEASNSTSGATVPTQLFETIIPGYGPIHNFLLVTFGVDITILVTLLASIWAMCKVGNYVFRTIYCAVAENYMASIHINSYDDIYSHLMKWLSEQPKIKTSRCLMAETEHKSAWEVDDEELEEKLDSKGTIDLNNLNLVNFSNQEAKAPPRFIPAFGTHRFWHRGTYYMLHRVHSTVFDGSSSVAFADKENLTLSCFGRSPQPIKRLLQDAKDFYLLDHNAKTVIRRPASKEMRRFGPRLAWAQVAHRPCRPMETVVLDSKRKAEVLADINEYLHPSTPRWYANRGIPYRRGYLFHGPPGTGKTSLSFALAGVFGLDIYVISLLEPTLTEEDLGQLFNSLPRRCVVLLEDIDTAGLIRSNPSADDEPKPKSSNPSESADEGWKMVDLAKALKKANKQTEEDAKKGISLSGLLNAIDGVASHEGRVLVMTTNKPEKLDDALIRPGRVDLQVAFGNATQVQIKELFERMYTSDLPRVRRPTTTSTNSNIKQTPKTASPMISASASASQRSSSSSAPLSQQIQKSTAKTTMVPAAFDLPARTLDECARDFASKIPDDKFSPAEIQGFLLKRKKMPQKACAEVERWVASMLEGKGSGVRVLDVQ